MGIHAMTLPSIFLAGFLFVSTGLAYDAFGTPRTEAYFQTSESKAPLVSQCYEGKPTRCSSEISNYTSSTRRHNAT